MLAAAAVPGEIFCAQPVKALRAGELLASGTRIARHAGLKIRGVRIDPKNPWRKHAVENIARMRTAALVGLAPPSGTPAAPGTLAVLRADPGTGGTRYLSEVAARAPRALLVSPSGSSFEPLGALRRALGRSIGRELSPMLLELADPLDNLLAGHGVKLDIAARLVTAFLWPRGEGQGPGVLLLDDVKHIDPATLEACVRAARVEGASFGVVARLDATGSVPSVLAAIPKGAELELAPLGREDAEQLAGACTNDALDAEAKKRWARLGGNVPLAVVEAVAYGIVSGDLAWEGDTAGPRSRASGRGKVRGAADWILLRAREESAEYQKLLALIAMRGGEAKVSRLGRILDRAGQGMDVDAALAQLACGRWVVDTQEDWVALPSRTHREALAGLVEGAERARLHVAAADVIEEEEGAFGQVEAAWHAAQADDGKRAARIYLEAARATAAARLEASTTQLIAFARRADPECEDAAMELLANALARGPSLAPPALSAVPASNRESLPRLYNSIAPAAPLLPEDLAPFVVDTRDSEPPTIAKIDLPPMEGALGETPAAVDEDEPTSSGADIATRLAGLAKNALLSADNAALERWIDGLRATGESPKLTERLRALSRLGRGDIGDALRVLRRTRASLDPKEHRLRCQTSLALGVALSAAGRPQEALLEGMDALARARQTNDERGAKACLAFLAKLYAAQGREEAARLFEASG